MMAHMYIGTSSPTEAAASELWSVFVIILLINDAVQPECPKSGKLAVQRNSRQICRRFGN